MHNKITIAIFILFLAVFSAGSIIYKNKTISENENRYLQELPEISAESLMDGTFENGMEDYVSDRLTGREFFIGIKNVLVSVIGQKDAGGVYFARDGYYIEKLTDSDVDSGIYKNNLTAVDRLFTALTENGYGRDHLFFMSVPGASAVLKDKLPAHAQPFDELSVISEAETKLENGTVIDLSDALGEVEYAFYKTDHHWTTDGAFAAFVKWQNETGKDAHDISDYTVTELSDSFRGTLYSKVLRPDSAYDTVKMYTFNNSGGGPDIRVVCDGEEKAFSYGFLDEAQLSKKDKYAAFYGGNYAEVRIETGAAAGEDESEAGKERLLVIKDSYANCFVPFMYNYYDDIYMLDMRYYNGSVTDYVSEHGITDVMILCSVSSFVSDRSWGKVGLV